MIIPSKATVVSGKVTLVPPSGFNGAQAVRLANFTTASLILTNLDGQGQSQQLLMPVQQNIYSAPAISTPATVTSSDPTISNASIVDLLEVEWSTEPAVDFAGGTYPCPISVPAQVVAQAIFESGVPNVLVTDLLYTGTIGAISSQVIDTSKYGSVIISIEARAITSFRYAFGDPNSNTLFAKNVDIAFSNAVVALTDFTALEIPVRGSTLQFTIAGSPTIPGGFSLVTVVGTNRIVPGDEISDPTGQNQYTATQIFPVGGETALNDVNGVNFYIAEGGTYFVSTLTSATPATFAGTFDIDTINGLVVADTAESHVIGGFNRAYKQVQLNQGWHYVTFRCTVSPGTAQTATLMISG